MTETVGLLFFDDKEAGKEILSFIYVKNRSSQGSEITKIQMKVEFVWSIKAIVK